MCETFDSTPTNKVSVSEQSKMIKTHNITTPTRKNHIFIQDLDSSRRAEYFRIPHCAISQIVLQDISYASFSSKTYAITATLHSWCGKFTCKYIGDKIF